MIEVLPECRSFPGQWWVLHVRILAKNFARAYFSLYNRRFSILTSTTQYLVLPPLAPKIFYNLEGMERPVLVILLQHRDSGSATTLPISLNEASSASLI
ncbi:hypothetical protein Zmor_011069 [Zophobas morio]|uniref:Uncharacterized protein n=1 Tax=Zophobas morio TaxID=2755281 RepID=A0AA38MKI9_9CUCU|nr:hypothetical protein Zmor_011069 [Zophobas morio]